MESQLSTNLCKVTIFSFWRQNCSQEHLGGKQLVDLSCPALSKPWWSSSLLGAHQKGFFPSLQAKVRGGGGTVCHHLLKVPSPKDKTQALLFSNAAGRRCSPCVHVPLHHSKAVWYLGEFSCRVLSPHFGSFAGAWLSWLCCVTGVACAIRAFIPLACQQQYLWWGPASITHLHRAIILKMYSEVVTFRHYWRSTVKAFQPQG